MVFIVIPPSDVDVGSPLDEKLMETIKVDLDDLDTRTTTNTTDITTLAAAGSGGGGGGGFRNRLYFETPGIWTSPATIDADVVLNVIDANGGAGGGAGGMTVSGTGGIGGAGGNATPTTFLTYTSVPSIGGAQLPSGPSANPVAFRKGSGLPNVPNQLPLYRFENTLPAYSELAANVGGVGGNAPVWPGVSPWLQGGAGGDSSRSFYKLVGSSAVASTLYPISIGQAGAGGGGGAGSGPGYFGGVGGGPNGGAGGVGAGPTTGGTGGIVSIGVIQKVGLTGSPGPGPQPQPNTGYGGGGGGSGVNGAILFYYND